MTPPAKLFRTTVFRLSLLYLAIFAGAIFASIAYIYLNTQVLLSRQLETAINTELQALAGQYRAGGLPRLVETVAERSATPGSSLYLVTDAEGRRLAGNLRVVTPALWNALGKVEFTYRRSSAEGSENRLAVAHVFRLDGDYRLIVGRDIEDRRQFEAVVSSAIFWGLAAMSLIGIGSALIIGRRLLARIDAVTAASQAIMAGGMKERLPLNGSGDELDRLSANLNVMFDRIEQLMIGLREVSDNIAHDLKTPLNRLRNRAEAALREGGGAAAYREALQDTIEEADELIRIFDALLKIARVEAGARGATFSAFDVSETLKDAAELYEPLAEEHGWRLSLPALPPILMNGERQLVAQALANLIDNAIKYGLPNGAKQEAAIELSAEVSGPFVEITVADHGPGIAESDRERAFKRFVRLEASRSKPGSGLGLSLVMAVARLHGGDVRLEDNQPGLKVAMRMERGLAEIEKAMGATKPVLERKTPQAHVKVAAS